MRFDYYLFDLDNCLLHIPEPSNYFDEILFYTLKFLSSKPESLPSRDERNQFWHSGSDYIKLLENWGINNYDHFWKYFDEIDFKKRKVLVDSGQIYLFPDVIAILDALYGAGKEMALISNAADYIVEYMTQKFKMRHYFSHLFGLGIDKDQSMAKPSPAGVFLILEAFNYQSNFSEAILIGDSVVDVYAAKRAGIKACLIERFPNKYDKDYEKWEHQPDYIIKNLEEIFNI